MSKHHAIHMRVGTKRQDTASQEPELKRWAQSHEGDSCWHHDSYTGTSMDRPGFRKLDKDIETGQVDTLVVWRRTTMRRCKRSTSAPPATPGSPSSQTGRSRIDFLRAQAVNHGSQDAPAGPRPGWACAYRRAAGDSGR
jgi:DNA invertase Pin-like site-specific DNA recombinase